MQVDGHPLASRHFDGISDGTNRARYARYRHLRGAGMPLTNIAIRNTKPKAKPYKLTDGEGMYLFVTPDGGRYWRMDYRFNGKRGTLAFGVYPEVSLAAARDKRASARKQLAAGIHAGQ